MSLFIAALVVIFAGGLLALVFTRKPALCTFFGVGGCVAGSVMGLIPAVRIFTGSPHLETFRREWNVPFGSFFLQLDPLSALFLIPIFGLSAIAAIYGAEYLKSYRGGKSLGSSWFFFSLLVVGMAGVVVARNGILFLMAWEIMSLASFFLVIFEDEKEHVIHAGWTYLVATHLGTAFLVVFFLLLGHKSGSLDFDHLPNIDSSLANILFLLAVVGFGTKAGFWPLHVWLPEAHPVAPSHVSAVMSGVMIKTGIYGLVRTLLLLGHPPIWWGWLLIGIGASSGILGVLFALAQHDLKRLLAYHSVENIGIITLGLGTGIVGIHIDSPTLAVLGFAGGLFHVINHALFKGLLFLGAGSVLHGSGSLEIDRLGGLIKRMPWTAVTFLVGAIAICGLPPLNGFASEFLIYLGVFKSPAVGGVEGIIPALGVVGGLALIGGLAAACFTKAFGIVFLGEPRSEQAAQAHESGPMMRFSMVILAMGCILTGFLSPWILKAGTEVLKQVTSFPPDQVAKQIHETQPILGSIIGIGALFVVIVAGLVFFRRSLLSSRTCGKAGTWDCGYVEPTARMQYTASSFAQPIASSFRMFLRTKNKSIAPEGIFPPTGAFHSHTPDLGQEYLFGPTFKGMETIVSRLRWLQQGRIQLYILYIALTLWILLVWKLR